MKLRILIGFCILFLLFQSVYALEESYPFVARFIDQNENGIANLPITIMFEDCVSKEILTNNAGEFVFVINYPDDIIYKDSGESCIIDIENDFSFSLLIDKTVLGCKVEEYGDFKTGSSMAAMGTHMINLCEIEEDKDYIPPSVSGGGGSRREKKKDDVIVIKPEELEDFIKSIEEKPAKVEEKKPLLERIKLPSLALSQNYIIMLLLLFLVLDLVVLIWHLKRKERMYEKEINQ